MIELLRGLPQRARVTVLHISHSRHEAEQLGDLIFRLQDGQIEVIKTESARTSLTSENIKEFR
jgi:ABC-type sulfate/molybdate transport systems ATPase subunit